MKNHLWLLCLMYAVLLLSGCNDVIVSRYALTLPELPPVWDVFPGPPHWKIEWLDPDGAPQTAEIRSDERLDVALPHTWASAVTAWPYWPELSVHPGIFKPAGALFPLDVSGDSLLLSWKGGIDAILYRELGTASTVTPAANTGVPRLPWHFNWPRFRELYDDPTVNADFRGDPWLADWPGIAARIWQSGFDKRRLVPYARQEVQVPVGPGPWIGVSPFAAPLFFDGVPVFPVRAGDTGVDIWVSAEGILRCTDRVYLFQKWDAPAFAPLS
jgi:hypothetical protein